jgi:hypothetical protein
MYSRGRKRHSVEFQMDRKKTVDFSVLLKVLVLNEDVAGN